LITIRSYRDWCSLWPILSLCHANRDDARQELENFLNYTFIGTLFFNNTIVLFFNYTIMLLFFIPQSQSSSHICSLKLLQIWRIIKDRCFYRLRFYSSNQTMTSSFIIQWYSHNNNNNNFLFCQKNLWKFVLSCHIYIYIYMILLILSLRKV